MGKIYSIGISSVLTLDMHSLNNEGGEGSQILTRQVTISDEEGKLHTVNAISGDMYKHIQAEHLYYISKEKKLSLCKACNVFDPNRITGDTSFKFDNSDSDEMILDNIMKTCTIDDLEGILITNNKKNIPIKSKIEFGWVVGIPRKNKSENHFHVKLVPNVKKDSLDEDGANMGQNIFHRPANSGQYAFVANIDCFRIGYNEITRKYAIDELTRKQRYEALLKSMLYTIIKPNGAMRNTQNPHIVNVEGILTVSYSTTPAPLVSPIKDDYNNQIKEISNTLNDIESKEVIKYYEYNDMKELIEIFKQLLEQEPASIRE